ncbi:MAG: helix-turn-helix domain-containing protein [Pirellulales bacterium]
MPRSRSTSAGVARLLNAARRPVYVLDDEGRIVFVNRALRDWLGPGPADRLVGRQCRYHSAGPETQDDAATMAAGLCPPPSATDGQADSVVIAVPMPDGRVRRRCIRVLPIGLAADEAIGSVVILGDEPPAEGPPPERMADGRETGSEAARLHQLLWDFRRRAAVRYGADRLVGETPEMRRVRQQVALAAETRASVLLVGPEGSGRQHTAAAIHYRGDPGHAGPLVPLACDLLGADLILSAIAAVSAAEIDAPPAESTDRRSAGDLPAPGSLLLRQVDQMPLEVQRSVAHAVSKRSFRPRLLATAGQPLDEMVRRGRFRPELAAVLTTLVIHLPPLVQRRDDIPLLTQLFLEEQNAEGDRQLDGFSSEAMDQLVAHSWPGNLDELAEAVAEAHGRAQGRELGVEDLPPRLRAHRAAAAHPPREPEKIMLDEFLERIERELLRRALDEAKGNKAQAARLLGLTRPRLYRRLTQLGIE